jgi:hypothetical protein
LKGRLFLLSITLKDKERELSDDNGEILKTKRSGMQFDSKPLNFLST